MQASRLGNIVSSCPLFSFSLSQGSDYDKKKAVLFHPLAFFLKVVAPFAKSSVTGLLCGRAEVETQHTQTHTKHPVDEAANLTISRPGISSVEWLTASCGGLEPARRPFFSGNVGYRWAEAGHARAAIADAQVGDQVDRRTPCPRSQFPRLVSHLLRANIRVPE